ncbi:LytR/AlgR family response regulator transcription factor [Massilia luteola]|jgi:two-component system LytT family response regulator|uniref:LytR/AlgR family response regulator transcription factor n=1 Tax=Massilia luteola TaxID=3081751 RepID=UPI002ACC1AD4|nr:response regulator [Massilia sp. Gc5]
MRLLIVDDERPARAKLRHLLAQQDGIAAVDEAADGIEALERITAFRPDALLLDIEMPELSGIELAASLPEPAPLVVFVTAYERYACQAFDADAIDYLLKPYDGERLGRALARLRKKLETRPDGQAVALPPAPLEQLLVSERGATRIVRVADIQWIETADNYVVLHTAEGAPLLRQTLAGLVERLGAGFVRCHRRAAVAVGWIERIVALDKGDGELQLRGGARVPCSRQYRADVMARL